MVKYAGSKVGKPAEPLILILTDQHDHYSVLLSSGLQGF